MPPPLPPLPPGGLPPFGSGSGATAGAGHPRIQRDTIMAALFQLLTGALAASFSAATMTGFPTLTGITGLVGTLWPGLPLFGPGIAAGAVIESLDSPTQLTMTLPASATSAGAVALASGLQTSGRRLIPWGEVAAQPALFLRRTGGQHLPRPTRRPERLVIDAEVWLYSNLGADPDLPPEVPLNALCDAVQEALMPPLPYEAQTLGGLVAHCWIEGDEIAYPGDLDGQAIAVLPVKMLVPGVSPTGGPALG